MHLTVLRLARLFFDASRASNTPPSTNATQHRTCSAASSFFIRISSGCSLKCAHFKNGRVEIAEAYGHIVYH